MEWDKIADRWAQMTHRIRSDRSEAPRTPGTAQDARFATTGSGGDSGDRLAPAALGSTQITPFNP